MTLQSLLYGEPQARVRIVTAAVLIPILASVMFLLGYDAVLGLSLLYLSIAAALFAGWIRAGLLAGCGVVFLTILWRFVVPPLVGYLRWSMDTRYTPPRLLGYKLDPSGELFEGLTHGPVYALGGAIVLGGTAYLIGALLRRASSWRAAEN